jgi:hypothetical protein
MNSKNQHFKVEKILLKQLREASFQFIMASSESRDDADDDDEMSITTGITSERSLRHQKWNEQVLPILKQSLMFQCPDVIINEILGYTYEPSEVFYIGTRVINAESTIDEFEEEHVVINIIADGYADGYRHFMVVPAPFSPTNIVRSEHYLFLFELPKIPEIEWTVFHQLTTTRTKESKKESIKESKRKRKPMLMRYNLITREWFTSKSLLPLDLFENKVVVANNSKIYLFGKYKVAGCQAASRVYLQIYDIQNDTCRLHPFFSMEHEYYCYVVVQSLIYIFRYGNTQQRLLIIDTNHVNDPTRFCVVRLNVKYLKKSDECFQRLRYAECFSIDDDNIVILNGESSRDVSFMCGYTISTNTMTKLLPLALPRVLDSMGGRSEHFPSFCSWFDEFTKSLYVTFGDNAEHEDSTGVYVYEFGGDGGEGNVRDGEYSRKMAGQHVTVYADGWIMLGYLPRCYNVSLCI